MPIMLNICEEKRIMSFRPLVKYIACVKQEKIVIHAIKLQWLHLPEPKR